MYISIRFFSLPFFTFFGKSCWICINWMLKLYAIALCLIDNGLVTDYQTICSILYRSVYLFMGLFSPIHLQPPNHTHMLISFYLFFIIGSANDEKKHGKYVWAYWIDNFLLFKQIENRKHKYFCYNFYFYPIW